MQLTASHGWCSVRGVGGLLPLPSGFLFTAADAAELHEPADEFPSLPRLLLHQRSRTVLRHLVLWS